VSSGRALRFTRTAEKELRRLDPPIRARVLGALDRLSADDRSLDVRRLTGSEHFRLRVGDWRVIFDYDRATETVLVRHVPDLTKAKRVRMGRPALGDGGVSPRVQVRVDPDLAKALRARARKEHRSVSEIARVALREYVDRAA
jgi:mRNA interferase RelE/StbE